MIRLFLIFFLCCFSEVALSMNIQPVSLSLTEQAKWLKLLQPDAELISPADPRLQNPPSDRNTPLKKKQMRAY